MSRTLVILCCVFLAVAHCQTRPQFSTVFEAKLFLQYHKGNATVKGEGHWIQDMPNGKAVEFFNFEEHRHHQTAYRLQRYDLGFAYQVDLHDNSSCVKTPLTGNMPNEWGWIANATFNGTTTYKHWSLDWWQYNSGYSHVELAVDHTHPNRPVILIRRSNDGVLHMEFSSWQVIKPQSLWFDVPNKCPSVTFESNELLGCASRSSMISRAQTWVDAHVPYNQGATYQGYREDCSGYVSMAWETSKPGYTTSTLSKIAHPISRSDLKPGDILLCSGQHVVLFGGWANSNEYIAYEETKPGVGTVKKNTPYPYWYNTGCFLPYRYNNVC